MSIPQDLKDKVNEIVKDSGHADLKKALQNNKVNREILYWERILAVSKIEIPFSVGIDDLFLSIGKIIPKNLGPQSFTCDLYKLSWEKDEDEKFCLFIENIQLKRKLLLHRAPYWIREVLAPLLEPFSMVFSKYLERIEKGLAICDSVPRNQSLFQ